uniref:Uncharacterized protein n=1 Tax=Amphimedon queenslandica TaxID=400682 RepID=A0A1X7TF03_AMPQE
MYSSSWFLALFACLHSPLTYLVFLIDGIKVIFRVGLALLEGRSKQTLEVRHGRHDQTLSKRNKFLSEEGCDALFEDESIFKKLKKMEKIKYNQLMKRQQGQVTRAQEYEEVYSVRRELTTLRKKVPSFEKKEESQNNHVHNILETECTSALSLENTSQQPPPHYWFQLKKEIKNRTHRQICQILLPSVSTTAEEETLTALPETSPADSLDVERLL